MVLARLMESQIWLQLAGSVALWGKGLEKGQWGLPAKMEAEVDTLCLLAQPKEGQQQAEKQKQIEMTENQTVWKSDNKGVKEETFIQTSRRDGERAAGERGLRARQQLADWVVPHSCADKLGGTTGERDRPHNVGSSSGK